jgi:hypothetical protein
VRLDLIGLTPGDIDAAAVGLPSRDTGSVMLVGVGNTLVILLAILVFVGIRVGIAAAPESFDKLLALFISAELLEGFLLFVGNNVGDVL